MFYGKMESRNEDIVFPARAGNNSQKLSHYAVVCLMRQSVFAAERNTELFLKEQSGSRPNITSYAGAGKR